MLKRTLVAILLVLTFSTTMVLSQIMVNPTKTGTFDTPLEIKAGQGTWVYEFVLQPASSPTADDAEWIHIDFVNANKDFTFTLSHMDAENPYPGAAAARSKGMKFFKLQLSDDTVDPATGIFTIDVGMVLRWKYRTVTVDPTSMEFLIYRGTHYYEFDHYSELDEPTGIIAQSFPRDELQAGVNVIGIFGGDSVTVNEDDDPRYNSFETKYDVKAATANRFEFKMDRKQLLDIEYLTPSKDFAYTITRSAVSPVTSALPDGLSALYYFNFNIDSAVQPGPTGLRYGIVLRFLYPYGIPDTVDESTLNFMIHDGTKWAAFTQQADRSVYTKYVSQSSNELLDFKKLNMNVALVAKVSGTKPEESTITPVQSSTKPQVSNEQSTENPVESSVDERDDSSGAVSLQIKLISLFLGVVALAAFAF